MRRVRCFHLALVALCLAPQLSRAAPDLDALSAAQAAADICAGTYSRETLVRAAVERAKARADLNAFITLDETGALKAARAADAARKRGACKPLDGVPVVLNDNIEVPGLPSSAGTPALKGFVPKADAPAAARLRAAGAIVLERTFARARRGQPLPRALQRAGEYGLDQAQQLQRMNVEVLAPTAAPDA